jgi:hypothetical protein
MGSVGVVRVRKGRRKRKARIVCEVGVLEGFNMYIYHFWERLVWE